MDKVTILYTTDRAGRESIGGIYASETAALQRMRDIHAAVFAPGPHTTYRDTVDARTEVWWVA